MDIQGSNEISRLLGMRGYKRLEVDDDITQRLLGFDYSLLPGLNLRFLETKKKENDWTEYLILYQVQKYRDTTQYFKHIFDILSVISKELAKITDIDSIGIQEVECGLTNYYYFLIYILK